MGSIISWFGCTPEVAIIEYAFGTSLFFFWFFTMKLLGYYHAKEGDETIFGNT